MGVKFTSFITALNVKMGEVTETLDLPIERSLDKVDGGKNTIRDDSGIVSGFYAVNQPFCHFRRDSVSSKDDANLRTHQATSSASVSPITELGTGGAKRQLKIDPVSICHFLSKYLAADIQVVNGIKREQSSVRCLVDSSTKSSRRGVGGAHGTGGGDLSVDVGLCRTTLTTDPPFLP